MSGIDTRPTIARIDRTGTGLWSLTLRPGPVLVIVAVSGRGPLVGFLEHRPAGEGLAADGTVRGMRERLEGGKLERAGVSSETASVIIETRNGLRTLHVSKQGVWDEEGGPEDEPPAIEIPEHGAADDPEPELIQRWRALLLQEERRGATHLLSSARKRLQRRIEAIDDDAERAAKFEQEATEARSLVPQAARAPRGTRVLEGTDWSTGEARTIRRELDPARGAREQLEEVFKRARRMKQGEGIRSKRWQEAVRAIDEIELAIELIAEASSASEVRPILAQALQSLPAGTVARGAKAKLENGGKADSLRAPVDDPIAKCAREYRSQDGTSILVGRDAKANDTLTTRVARPHDVWMHVRGRTGSHVVVRVDKGKEPSTQALVDGATLAVHFSDARGEDGAEVSWCERRFVRKPKGSAPGLVSLSREKTMRLRWEDGRLERLLATLR